MGMSVLRNQITKLIRLVTYIIVAHLKIILMGDFTPFISTAKKSHGQCGFMKWFMCGEFSSECDD
ncbi:hypothetical protein DVA81_18630, partial [Acinetobacter baumannii]